ncbi:ACP S-malonyltransferase [Streptomyces carpaticus]|uniref:ACP S-malonyltransferase n=1 Tax=Streptomyces TaxID=1883 RepID=UPI001590CE4F|nr:MULTISPECIES: ACP S-malonyltransferase [Streptomyces]MCK1814293.1 ACP S-malonyltransferase [Streptomyces sp. XM4011]QKV68600.1 ACP S-malonyltransferase [Streptomyces harbinensis]UWM48926.1 ACP S-malonyltransferase [Streptomyces carpaticus]
MFVLVAPGQGAQAPGFLRPWLDVPGAGDRLTAWSDAIGLDLIRYGTEADADEIRDTAVAQPLLVAGALLSARALLGEDTRYSGVVAGHSVGELAAAAIAGVLSDEEAMTLVRKRGLAMAEAAAVTETGMSAVLGGDPDEVAAKLDALGLTPANNNGGGQIVAAGTLEQLAALAADKPEKARVIALKVAGAFHTRHMAPAVAAMEAAVRDVGAADPHPSVRYVSNADGEVVRSGKEIVSRLVSQVSNPVRWDLCMDTFRSLEATALVELCPGGTLAGLAKRNLKGVAQLAIKSPEELPQARELLAAAGAGAGAGESSE